MSTIPQASGKHGKLEPTFFRRSATILAVLNSLFGSSGCWCKSCLSSVMSGVTWAIKESMSEAGPFPTTPFWLGDMVFSVKR